MLKLIEMPGVSESGDILVQAFVPEQGLSKTAATDKLHPEIRKFLDGLRPDKSKLYVLVNALGAGEYYGSNINGDMFEEAELRKSGDDAGYRTFLKSGVFRHHQNKDIDRSMGKVVCAVYNEIMHRVELVIEIDREKAKQEGHQDLVDQLDAGKNPAVSMGCRVKFDVCSICGNKSKTRADYCLHAKTQMGQILSNGQKVWVTNPDPRFFDLSFVIIGADRTSYAMAKVARAGAARLSADLAEEYGLRDRAAMQDLTVKLADRQKLSNLLKRVPAMSAKSIPPITAREKNLPDHVLDRLAQYPLKQALTTCSAAGIVLKPAEYQRLVLAKMGKKDRASQLAKQGMVFRPSDDVDTSVHFGDPRDYDCDIRDLLRPYLEDRSMFDPLLSRRIERGAQEKTASCQPTLRFVDDPLLGKIAAGYRGYRQQLLLKVGNMVDTMTVRDPSLLAALSGRQLEDLFVDTALAKSASALPLALLGAVPLAYLFGAHMVGTKESAGSYGSWVADHPVLATSILVGLTRLGVGLQQSGHFSKLLAKAVGK
jgi:hypothetical protein